jgi:hypothetical protein
MKSLFLHMGMHKTGTTTFQTGCAEHRDEMLKKGIVYYQDPISSINQNHFRWFVQEGRHIELENMIRSTLECGPHGERYIISGEDISYMSDEEFNWLIDVLKIYFDDIYVVAALRQPISYMSSAAQEILKEPRTTIQDLMFRSDVSPIYRIRFEKAITKLGLDNCKFLAYSNRIVDHIVKYINIPFHLRRNAENISMTFGVAVLLNAAKQRAPSVENPIDTFEGVADLIRMFEDISTDHRRFRVPREVVEVWQDQIQSDLEWLSTVWQVPADFYGEDVPITSMSEFSKN